MFHNYLSFCFQFFQSIMKQWIGTANCVWIGNSTGQSHVSETPKRFRPLTFDSMYMQPLHLLTGQQQDWITVASPSLAAFVILTSPCPTYTGENDWGHPEHFYMTYPNCAEGTNFDYGKIQFHNLQMYFDVWTEGVQLYQPQPPCINIYPKFHLLEKSKTRLKMSSEKSRTKAFLMPVWRGSSLLSTLLMQTGNGNFKQC